MRDHSVCLDEMRKAFVRDHPTLNGIDYVEYFEDLSVTPQQYWIAVHFLKNAPAGLAGNASAFAVEGGVRIVGVEVTSITAGADSRELLVYLDRSGDFSSYVLRVEHADLDRELKAATFGFKTGCPSPFDCRTEVECPPEQRTEPVLDYLAKDYASFRRLLLDFVTTRNPEWTETSPADLGVAIVELFAYWGDRLSYFQDAVATEAYLDTCRQRISASRHARLVDYRVHEGRNAWTHVQLDVSAGGDVPQGTRLLTRVARPLANQPTAPGVLIPASSTLDFENDPALASTQVFETTVRITAHVENDQLYIHAFGDRECCLPKGTRGVYVYATQSGAGGVRTAVRPPLQVGDYLLLEEVKGVKTGLAADADPAHRQVVRLSAVEDRDENGNPLVDPVFQDALTGEALNPVTPADEPKLPLLRLEWSEENALTFPLCLSADEPDVGQIDHISLAWGNVVPCDHGRTVVESHLPVRDSGRLGFALAGAPGTQSGNTVSTAGRSGVGVVRLGASPLTFQAMPPTPSYDAEGRLREARHDLDGDVHETSPAVVLTLGFPPAETEIWEPHPHLMNSRAFDRHFAVEVDNDGTARLRFGDDEYGRRPLSVTAVTARYRVGNGRAGNLGAGALCHVVEPQPADMIDPANPGAPPAMFPVVTGVRQPLAARDGADAETIEEVRQLAPRAFRAKQFRAVTEADYEKAALALTEVAAAKCAFRWTGSWHTVFVALHPRERLHIITRSGGRTQLTQALEAKARNRLSGYKLAGYDLEIRTARYVPLEIELQVCVANGYFRADIVAEAYRALSNRRNEDGSSGFFHPERLGFGEDIYLSQIYAVLDAIEGVESVVVTKFERYWEAANDELNTGVIEMGDREIARLDNDANFAENGVLTITALGGA